jgi:BirA family transcriptional regulator, biotin operon repressor / biotin---[acetyl-CoA-carboxylase] ligase
MGDTSFHLDQLRDGLRPLRLHWFPRLRSTNDHAAAMRKAGRLFAPAAVLTGCQTAGRGRGGNVWWSGAGSLTVTFAMPIEEYLSPHQIPLVAGLAVRNAAAELAGNARIGLKWPNDVIFEGRKLAGVLCERVHRVDLIGVGMNLNIDPAQAGTALAARMTSLRAIAGRPMYPTEALICVGRELYQMLSRRGARPFAAVLQEYDQYHTLVGKRVSITGSVGLSPINGRCEGLDHLGRLIVRSRGQIHRVVAGHVEPI